MSNGYSKIEIESSCKDSFKENPKGIIEKISPNKITLFRIFLLPLPVALLFLEGYLAKVFSLGLGSLLGATDYIDGFLARKRKQITPLGALLDPVADKIFVTVVFLTLVYLNYFPFVPVALLLSREIFVALFRSLFPEEMRVVNIARFKTFFQMSLAGLAILISILKKELLFLTHYLLWFVAIFSYLSAFPYFYRVRKALKNIDIGNLLLTKSFLSLLFNLTLLIVFPIAEKLFWIIILALSFYFFRKGLAKSSPLHAQEESFIILLLLFFMSLEIFFKGSLFFSLWGVLFFSLYRDGIKSFRLMWEILTLK
ncbi:MAG: CDP-alcohol phosphatidyltransferase family protein [Caldimicrobium sp.]